MISVNSIGYYWVKNWNLESIMHRNDNDISIKPADLFKAGHKQ